MQKRIEGYDVARALAIFGMVFVNFRLACEAEHGSALLLSLVASLEGRASALFVVLAGIGLALLSQSAQRRQAPGSITGLKVKLLRRALLLIAIGLAYTPIWPADILHFYGVYFLAAIPLLFVSNRSLWLAIAAVNILFSALFLLLDYGSGWDFKTLHYEDFWSLTGMLRHILFNGFHPLLPWLSFLLLGIWLGRQALYDTLQRRRIAALAASIWLISELLSRLTLAALQGEAPAEDLQAIFGTSAMPPLLPYMLAAGSLAVLMVCLCVEGCLRWPKSQLVQLLACTGRMSLSLYVAHVLIGMAILEAMGLLPGASVEAAALAALLFCTGAIIASRAWAQRFGVGPLESLFKRLAGS